MGDATVSLMVEYMNGGSLQSIADSGGCDDPATLASIASQTLKGLRFLHRGQHLHRDIKVWVCALFEV
jgi:serine/threonine protein kinase